MKRCASIMIVLCTLMLTACQSIEQLSIDYMLPAEVSFPEDLKRVGIVNNVNPIPDNKLLLEKGTPREKEGEISRDVIYSEGKAATATNALAHAIADQNYFEEVIICDSALRANDHFARETTLTPEEVQQLTQTLNVDFIIALENLQLKATKLVRYIPDWTCFQGTIDMKVYPSVKVYLPSRRSPLVIVNATDSIFWEELGVTQALLHAHLITDSEMIEEASDFAGTVPVKHLLPYWKTANRYLYTNGSVNMRDAAVYVRENSWAKAAALWEKEFNSVKSKKRKMYAASNIALYYEMNDSIEEAEKWALEAQSLARIIDKVDEKIKRHATLTDLPNYFSATLYVTELKQRKDAMSKLKLQMKRFDDNF